MITVTNNNITRFPDRPRVSRSIPIDKKRIFVVGYVESAPTTYEVSYVRAIDISDAKRLFTLIMNVEGNLSIRYVVDVEDLVIN